MRGLEYTNRLERRPVLLRTKHERLEAASVRSNTRQCSQEVGSRSERHLGLGLVADDTKLRRESRARGRLGQ
jgi:hypothetical protein